MSTMPDTIFKYESCNLLSLQNLKAQSVYFASPRQFNDPYDCAITAGVAQPTEEELEKMRQYYLKQPHTPDPARVQLETSTAEQLREMLMRSLTTVVNASKEKFAAENGVCCFSERNDDLLMWSHYGGRYKGFCLEFRKQYEPFSKLFKVTYVDTMPKLQILPFVVDQNAIELIRSLYCTKSRDWAYEREWRGLHASAGTLFGYDALALKAVYFGPDIEPLAREIICLILGGQNLQVEFWNGKRSEDEFKVNFERFDYIPYIKAKEMGLIKYHKLAGIRVSGEKIELTPILRTPIPRHRFPTMSTL
jgi:hypothetical protein